METEITPEILDAIADIGNAVIPKKAKRKDKLPAYLTEEEYIAFIKNVVQPQHKMAFNLAYGSGLRVSEVTGLQKEDIDLSGRRIHIKDAKGGHDRIYPLPKGFPESNMRLIPIKCGDRALQIAFKRYIKIAGITKPGLVFHSLRHSFAVRCMNKGMPLNTIQILLGHSNIATTSIYTRINPVDALKKYEEYW